MCRALAAWQAQDSLAAQHPVHFVGREVDPAAHPDILRVQNRVALKSASDPALANLLASSAALLLCSHHEGFGLPVVEALASGAMPVVSDLAVFREIGGSDCIYVDRHDPAAIAQGLSQAIRATVPEGVSQAISQRFGWSQSGQHMAQVLRDLVAA
jgi:glycosyltransferase involved in cell wall biosynthesis